MIHTGLSEEKTPLCTKPSSSSSVSDSDFSDTPGFNVAKSNKFFSENGSSATSPTPASNENSVQSAFEPLPTPGTQEIPTSAPKPETEQGFSSLIDIGTPSPGSNPPVKEPFAAFQQENGGDNDFFGNLNAAAPAAGGTSGATQESLVDPFASLATSRTSPQDEMSNDDILLNFGSSPKSTAAPDLLNTNGLGSNQSNVTPDLLQAGPFSTASMTTSSSANTSLNDLNNDDFFSRKGQPAPAHGPFGGGVAAKLQHSGPRKSNSESNLLEMGDSFHGDFLQPEAQPSPLHHAASSGAVSGNFSFSSKFLTFLLYVFIYHGHIPAGKFTEKAVWRSVFLTKWHCILNAN